MMGQLNNEDIENLLRKSVLGRIGCTDGDSTYVVPISYAYDGKYIYCHTCEGKKIDMLRKNPLACFEVEHIPDLGNWQTVITHGVFEELTDPALRMDALQKLNDRKLPVITSRTTILSEEWPFTSKTLNQITGITFRILLTDKTGRFEKARQEANIFY
jgi:nitroimidazol reductase NimA-like FMN-containing flavoprotein (pyridoxamine 5'-phosphate oxidase superfamily)